MRVEETGDWRKLHIVELHGLCSSPNIFWMRWTWNGEIRSAYTVLLGKLEGKRTLS
jgi:hypothetical protein